LGGAKIHSDRPASEKSSKGWPNFDKEPIIEWVAQFLNYWEDERMLYWPAAEIIVNQVVDYLILSEGVEQKGPDQMPDPSSYFHT